MGFYHSTPRNSSILSGSHRLHVNVFDDLVLESTDLRRSPMPSCCTKFHKNLSLSIKLTFVTQSVDRSREKGGHTHADGCRYSKEVHLSFKPAI